MAKVWHISGLNDYVVIREGKATLKVPNPMKYLRQDNVYEPAWAPVFYNPQQTLNRDLSVVVLATLTKTFTKRSEPLLVADPFSGTGVRAIRYVLEVPSIDEAYANDLDLEAYNLIKENVKLNNLGEKIRVFRLDANAFLYLLKTLRKSFILVDIDPYGTPAPYVDAGIWALRRGGVLCVTATDTATLGGFKFEAGSKRYDVKLSRNDIPNDVGIRILLGFMARRAATRDRYLEPLLAYHEAHYYRVFVRVGKGADKALNMVETQLSYLELCLTCGYRDYVQSLKKEDRCPVCGGKTAVIGPLWRGSLNNVEFLNEVKNTVGAEYQYLSTYKRIVKLLDVATSDLTHLKLYNVQTIARFLKVNIPQLSKIVECLTSKGFKASKTSLCYTCIRTDADWSDLVDCVKGVET